ncbi:MAG: DUF4388 domain-containing protein [Myxococcota bacterium]
MAVRTATRRWSDLAAFLNEYPTTLRVGALVLPKDALEDEPAPEMKIDLLLPLVGRHGPVGAQVVARMPDGSTALRIPEMPEKVANAIRDVFAAVEDVKGFLLATKQVAPPGGVDPAQIRALEERVRQLEAELADARAGAPPPSLPGDDPVPVAPPPQARRGRGFPLPDVSRVQPALSGTLSDRSLRDAFMALAIEKVTGLLVVRYKDRVRYGFWSKGGPVGWRTDPVDEQEVLGVLMLRAGNLTKEQVAQSVQLMEKRNCRQGEALIEMGVISFPQLVMLLAKQAEFVLQRVLADREGTWAFYPLEDLPERFVTPPIRVAALMFRALLAHVKGMPAEDLAATLRPWLDRYLYLAPGTEQTFGEMKLNADEQQFVKIVGGTVFRMREVFSVSSLSRSQTAGFVWVLHELNLVEFRDEGTAERRDAAIAKDLEKRKKVMLKGTLFERLDIHWICTTAEVEAGYRKIAAEFRPETVAKHWGESNRALVEMIAKAIDDAYATLKVDARRREYRLTIIEKTMVEQSAELLAKQGEMAIMKQARRDAVSCWSKCVELVPNNAEYRDGLKRAEAIPASPSGA